MDLTKEKIKTYEDAIQLLEENKVPRYERSKPFKIYFETIKNNPDKSKELEKVRKEIFAFDLSTHASPNERFSPMFTAKTDKGEDINYPDKSLFDDKFVEYYTQRFSETKNPILKCRYGDLIWELKNEFSIVKETIDNYLLTGELYFKLAWDYELCDSLMRAMQMSISIGDKEYIEKSYKKIIEISGILIKNKRPRFILELIENIVKYSSKIKIVDFNGLESLCMNSIKIYEKEITGSFNLQRDFFRHLEQIYRINNNAEKEADMKQKIFNSFLEEADWKLKNYPNGELIKVSFLQQALQYALNNGSDFSDKIDGLKVKIESINRKIKKSSFKKIQTSVSIPNKKIEEYLTLFDGKTTIEILQTLCFNKDIFISFDNARLMAEEQAKKYALQHLTPVQLYKGHIIIKNISGEQNKLEYSTIRNFILGYQMGMNLIGVKLFELVKKQDKDYTDSIFKYISEGEFIRKDSLPFIENSLKLYEKKEFCACIHILVFQIESILRDVLIKFGIPTFLTIGDGEMRAKMLKIILDALGLINGFERDFIKFLSIFLSDLRGENLRNDLAHGLCEYSQMNSINAQILILILIRISSYKLVPLKKEIEK